MFRSNRVANLWLEVASPAGETLFDLLDHALQEGVRRMLEHLRLARRTSRPSPAAVLDREIHRESASVFEN